MGVTWTADKGVDGNTDSDISNGHCFHTNTNMSPWWQVDLKDVYNISQVNITNRKYCCGMLLSSSKYIHLSYVDFWKSTPQFDMRYFAF
jgi:hypothetical protein